MQPLIVPAILGNDSDVPDFSENGDATTPLETLRAMLDYNLNFLHSYGLDPEVTQQVFRQVNCIQVNHQNQRDT